LWAGAPVTAVVEIAERNPSGFKGGKPTASTGVVELADLKGATDQTGSKPSSRRASHAGGGIADSAVGLSGQPADQVTGIAPAPEGHSMGTPPHTPTPALFRLHDHANAVILPQWR
jgi:hypothetical protein